MTVPTSGEAYAKLMEHLRCAQEEAATLSHLARANDEKAKAGGWFLVSEQFKRMQSIVIELATGGLQ